jgi:hypothetical protein
MAKLESKARLYGTNKFHVTSLRELVAKFPDYFAKFGQRN